MAAATITSHALTGYLLLIVIVAFAFVTSRGPWTRVLRAGAVVAGALAGSAWLLVPAFRDRAWTRNGLPGGRSGPTPTAPAGSSAGWCSGELFDAHRLPVITVLAGIGTIVALRRARTDRLLRALLALVGVSLLLYFGRPTLGPLVDLLPARDDLFLPRMIVGVHLGGMLLAGFGLASVAKASSQLIGRRPLTLSHGS